MAHPPTEREKAGLAIIGQLGWGRNESVRELDEPRALSAMALLRRIQQGAKLEL